MSFGCAFIFSFHSIFIYSLWIYFLFVVFCSNIFLICGILSFLGFPVLFSYYSFCSDTAPTSPIPQPQPPQVCIVLFLDLYWESFHLCNLFISWCMVHYTSIVSSLIWYFISFSGHRILSSHLFFTFLQALMSFPFQGIGYFLLTNFLLLFQL